MKPTKEGIAVLRRVIKRIEAEPKRFEMGIWGTKDLNETEDIELPACGTVGCIAGRVTLDKFTIRKIKSMKLKDFGKLMERAPEIAHQTIMGFPGKPDLWGNRIGDLYILFYTDSWPQKFHRRYNSAMTPRRRAKAGIARIKHFIKTGE